MLSRIVGIGLTLLVGVPMIGWIGGMFAAPATVVVAERLPQAAAVPILKPANPIVEPGKVHWHASTESALAAAALSRKPVLLFHMMGRLDHQFC